MLIHGIGDNSLVWAETMADLSSSYTVIAPDLLGHGRSDKPRADYSVAAYANGVRDLLTVLGYERVTVVGHSLGGGVATQFAYQYPEMVERLVLVAAGGVSTQVHPALRIATAPVVNSALRVLQLPGATRLLAAAGALFARRIATSPVVRSTAGHDAVDVIRVLDGFGDNTGYLAFLRTLRAAVDWRGQVITMLDRAYLYERLPVQIVWGGSDAVIPVSHAHLVHTAIRGSRLRSSPGPGTFRSATSRSGSLHCSAGSSTRHRPRTSNRSGGDRCWRPVRVRSTCPAHRANGGPRSPPWKFDERSAT